MNKIHNIFKKLPTINYQLSTRKNGYTLIELLAVTSIIVIITGLIVGILYSTLRGGSKSRAVNDVSQNANYALSVISNTARLATNVTKLNGAPITDCTNPTPAPATSIEFEQESGNLVTFSCDLTTQSIASTSGGLTTYLIDNTAVKVDPQSCNFTCLQPSGNPYESPIIGISFTASQRSSSTLFENTANSVFKTSVTMRNFSP